jgi:hypothetical protein
MVFQVRSSCLFSFLLLFFGGGARRYRDILYTNILYTRDKVYTNFLYTGQSLYGTKFIQDKVYTGTMEDKVYTGTEFIRDIVHIVTKFIQGQSLYKLFILYT